MKDFVSNDLNIGDIVAFAHNPYADLCLGEIMYFTPKGCKVRYITEDKMSDNYRLQRFSHQVLLYKRKGE